ncbi:family 43 glycosylhydrolase [Microbacterium karelineae]|uniref:family 43 glycosylhydrolase n=1 Tax=Microbacterium karelineae TaxID=2654283 RepID=UPI0012EAFAF6|nr:family 43 glycosylhydrolase [Microbacterium karelineae]
MLTSRFAPRGEIIPGALFVDDRGEVAQLHGVGVQRFGDLFWAWGEDKSRGGLFGGVACYSSPDLATWTSHGHALAVDPTVPDLGPDRVVERPKVLRNAAGTYVMMLHIDSADYADARVGWATATRPEGPYEYRGSERPLGNLSRDIGVFADRDGTGYLMSEDRDHGLHVYRLTEDLLGVAEIVSTTHAPPSDHPLGTYGFESPTMIECGGLYVLLGSDLTGWSTNDNKYATAPSPAGPWSDWRDVAPPGSKTFDSQVSVVVPVTGSEATTYVYMGDRWNRDDLFHSAPVWLPLRVDGTQARLEWREAWTLDVATGVVS